MAISNKNKLIIKIISNMVVDDKNPLPSAVNFLLSRNAINGASRAATAKVNDYIDTIKRARNNPYKSDDEICGAILEAMESREQRRRP